MDYSSLSAVDQAIYDKLITTSISKTFTLRQFAFETNIPFVIALNFFSHQLKFKHQDEMKQKCPTCHKSINDLINDFHCRDIFHYVLKEQAL
jgi:hypothetical protein